MANPFYIEPANAMSPLQSLMQGYDRSQKSAKEQQLTAARQEAGNLYASGGDMKSVYGKLLGLGDAESVKAISGIGKVDTTELMKNVASENAARAAKGLPPLSPLDYESTKAKASAAINNVNTNVNATVNPVLKGVSDRFNENVEKANAARGEIESIHEGRNALDQGAITGAFADKQVMLTKIGGMFGVPQDKVANTEVLRSAIGTQVLAKAKALGANPTNTDRDYIEKVVGGQIELNEQSIRRIMDMQENWARTSIKRTNAMGQGLLKAYPGELGRVGNMLNVDEPPDYQTFRSRGQPKPAAPGKTSTGVPWRVVQ